jgi:hypothetical protein
MNKVLDILAIVILVSAMVIVSIALSPILLFIFPVILLNWAINRLGNKEKEVV